MGCGHAFVCHVSPLVLAKFVWSEGEVRRGEVR